MSASQPVLPVLEGSDELRSSGEKFLFSADFPVPGFFLAFAA